jgi:hypothetical protein
MNDPRVRNPGRWWHFPATVVVAVAVAVAAFIAGKVILGVVMVVLALAVIAVSGTALRKQLRERS